MSMRKEYDLRGGRPNPYAKRIGPEGRRVLIERFLQSENLVQLDDEVAAAFPSAESVNEALRLVLELRNVGAKPKKTTPKSPRAKRSA